ncbi:MAG: hypothetical protein ACJA01_002262 [Saprospiraceae bacterium]
MIYQIFLAKQKTFWLNRIYLLTAIIGSSVAPLIILPSSLPKFTLTDNIYPVLDASNPTQLELIGNTPLVNTSGVPDYITWIIIAISFLTAFKFADRLIKIIRLHQLSPITKKDDIRISIIDDVRTPFSFFNTMYIDHSTYIKGLEDQIFLHEKYHIQQGHSVDRIIIEIISIAQWMNPFLYLLKRDLIDHHEYAADAYAIGQTNDSQSYLSLLLSSARSSSSHNFLLQQFSHSSSIKRIKMITTSQQTGKGWKLSLAFILLLGCFISCSEDIEDISIKDDLIRTETKSISNVSEVYYYPSPPPPPAINRPSERLLNKWMNDPTIGIWIDEKRVNNSALSDRMPNDFSLYYVRGLKKEHEDYGKLKLTVELTTNNYYSKIELRIKKHQSNYKKKYPNGKIYPKEKIKND